jgi:hypothetical protein
VEIVFVGFAVLVVAAQLVVRWAQSRAGLSLEQSTRSLVARGRRLDASSIGEVPEASVVRVVGEVKRLDRWVVAPLSKRPCAHWRLEVSVLEYSPATRGTVWRALFERAEGLPFVLASPHGELCVDPALATVSVKRESLDHIKRGRGLPENLAELVESGGVSPGSLKGTKVCFRESIVAFGARVAVVGAGRMIARSTEGPTETGYRDSRPTWMCLSGTDDELLISDDRRLFHVRGKGGGIKVEALRDRAARAPQGSETAAWSAIDVDEFERRLAAKRRRWRLALVLLPLAGAAAIAGAILR